LLQDTEQKRRDVLGQLDEAQNKERKINEHIHAAKEETTSLYSEMTILLNDVRQLKISLETETGFSHRNYLKNRRKLIKDLQNKIKKEKKKKQWAECSLMESKHCEKTLIAKLSRIKDEKRALEESIEEMMDLKRLQEERVTELEDDKRSVMNELCVSGMSEQSNPILRPS